MRHMIAGLIVAGASPALAQHNGGMTMPMDMPMPMPHAATPRHAPPRKPLAAHREKPSAPPPKNAPAAPAADMPGMPGMPDMAMGNHPMPDLPPNHDGPASHMSAAPMSEMPGMVMGTSPASAGAVPTVETPPPATAGSGPARAADAIWGAAAMRVSRERLRDELGAQTFYRVLVDRAEYRAGGGGPGYLWDVDAYGGGDIDKLWFRSEGEGQFGDRIDRAELQALWSHAVGPWFDLQTGVRQDFQRNGRTHLVVGLRGLAPYMFDVDAAAFLSQKGELSARIEAELDQRITQRLRLQPRTELNLAAQNTRAIGDGAGLNRIELGLRLRYEIRREFAPYIGIAQEWRLGRSATYARTDGYQVSGTNFVSGVRLWF